ncbi:MAG: hypothetical protein ACK4YQ_12370 [Phenylobacterium sp.]|uniref:hypothetical protein n=1 Tax=Phenylobacterium sp. TaxID=1871053 RepID=UPI00391DB351
MSLRQAFEAEHARREAERRAREDAERQQQEADLARAQELYDLLAADQAFLGEKGVSLQMSATRFTVMLDHPDYRIQAYFEGGGIEVRSADKRSASTPTAAPRKHQSVDTVADAVLVIAQFLADETR